MDEFKFKTALEILGTTNPKPFFDDLKEYILDELYDPEYQEKDWLSKLARGSGFHADQILRELDNLDWQTRNRSRVSRYPRR